MLLKNGYLRNLLFIDIETVPQYASYEQLSEIEKELWATKHATFKAENETAEEGYLKRAGIYAEFGKIICISIGYFKYDRESNADQFRLKSFSGDDEKKLLQELAAIFEKHFSDSDHYHFCGHNIREFDVPYICRRMLIHTIKLPNLFDVSGKKPWEIGDIDTLHLWRFGDYKNYTSLKLLTHVLGIPSPKEDIEGKDVCRVYYEENGLNRIVEYCQRDVVTVARLLMRMREEKDPLEEKDVIISA